MAEYLVTGGAGFIGANVAKALLQRKHVVVIIDNLSTGFKQNIPSGAEFFQSDCQDPSVYERLGDRRFDAILHIAGQSSGEISFDDPIYDLRSNTESTLRLLQYALKTDCRRFIYASTMSVYGQPQDDFPIAETYTLNPESFYAVGKIASENYLRIYQKYGIQPTSLRLFNVYGPGQNLENLRQGMVSIYLAQMVHNKKVVVKGSLDRFRDFIYIDDVVEAFLLCLDNQNTNGHIFNIGTGIKTTVKDLLDCMINLYREDIPIEVKGNTPGDIKGIVADVGFFKKMTGFHPGVTLSTGLKNMLKWALQAV